MRISGSIHLKTFNSHDPLNIWASKRGFLLFSGRQQPHFAWRKCKSPNGCVCLARQYCSPHDLPCFTSLLVDKLLRCSHIILRQEECWACSEMKGKKIHQRSFMSWLICSGRNQESTHKCGWILRVWTLCGGEMQSKQERINMDALSYDLGFYT